MGVRHGVWGKMKWQFWEGPREQWWEWCVVQNWWIRGQRPNGDVGIEGNSVSDGKGRWNEMVQACVKEGWWLCFGKRARGSEDDQVDMWGASGEGEQEGWFGEGECLEKSEMESGSWKDCC